MSSLSPDHPTTLSPSLPARVEKVPVMVADASRSSGRQPEDVTIVAVTKTVDRDAIDEAYALGLRHFGENRVQDAKRKLAEPGPLPDGVTLHLIGQLQSNKAKPAIALFDIIESVDRMLVDRRARERSRAPWRTGLGSAPGQHRAGTAEGRLRARDQPQIDGAPGSLTLAAAPRADDHSAPGHRSGGDPGGLFSAAHVARRFATGATHGRSRYAVDGE